jgi:hypothetical protein
MKWAKEVIHADFSIHTVSNILEGGPLSDVPLELLHILHLYKVSGSSLGTTRSKSKKPPLGLIEPITDRT